MRRRAATLLGVGALLLAGCSRLPGDLYATDTDVVRAQRVWSDPWLAPDRLSVPEARWGSDGLVNRTAAARATRYVRTGTLAAVGEEVRAGLAADWTLVGVACTEDDVRALLTIGGTDPDAAAVAEVAADATDRDDPVDVSVVAVVPHHLDDDWPDLGPAVAPDDTCLAGGSAGSAAVLPDEEPRGPVDDEVDVPAWSDDELTEADRAGLEALAADPWYVGVGPAPEPETGASESRRRAPATTGRVEGTVAALVDDMTGWVPTYARCSRRTGLTVTLRLDGPGPVVARLVSTADEPRRVTWTVRLPVVAGPDQGWVDEVPELTASRCLDGAVPPTTTLAEGTPVGLLGELQAMR